MTTRASARIALVRCPLLGSDARDLAPPLGLLSLLPHTGLSAKIVDLCLVWHEGKPGWANNWKAKAVDLVLEGDPDIVGFTSMAVESHVALDLAQRVRACDPRVKIVLGGPHFGMVASQILKSHPFVSAVVVGEGEHVMASLCRTLLDEGDMPKLLGVVTHEGGVGADSPRLFVTGRECLRVPPLDRVDLDRYWHVNPSRLLNVELSRGCKYKCCYCYVNSHFGPNPQHVSPEMAADIMEYARDLGARRVFVVGDNFLNDRQWALETCRAIARRRLHLPWDCYATIPDVDNEIAAALGAAGCSTTYIGIDAVDATQQASHNKRFFKSWDSVRTRLGALRQHGVDPTAAFILTGLGAERTQTEVNLHAAIDLRIRNLAFARLNMLSEYPGTALADPATQHSYVPSRLKVDLLQDVPEPVRDNPLAAVAPHIYPFHSLHVDPERGEMLATLTFDMDHMLEWAPYFLHAMYFHLSSSTESETPVLDWWQVSIWPRLKDCLKATARRHALQALIPELVDSVRAPLVRAAWEFEQASGMLARNQEQLPVCLVVGRQQVNVLARASVRLSREAARYFQRGAAAFTEGDDDDTGAASNCAGGEFWRVVAVPGEDGTSQLKVASLAIMQYYCEIGVAEVCYPADGTCLTADEFRLLLATGLVLDVSEGQTLDSAKLP